MKLSVNVETLLPKYGLARGIDIYTAAGFEVIDYPLCEMAKDDSPFNGPAYRTVAEEVRRVAGAKGTSINQTHTPFQFGKLFADPVALEEIIVPRTVRSLEISAILGAKVAVVHPLHYKIYAGHEEEIFEENMKFYRRLLPYCKEYGVQLGVENMFQSDPRRKCLAADVCSTSAEFVRYIDTLDSPFAVACVDVGHVGLPAGGEEAQDVIRALGHDRLKALHMHDNDYRTDLHLPPFFGQMNWKEIAAALGEIDYDGDFTLELSSKRMMSYEEDVLPLIARFAADASRHIMQNVEKNRKKA